MTADARATARPVSVLLVEDQDAVRRFASLTLQGQGHEVSEAESGEAALELAGAGEQFDLLVTDVTMPGMDGQELAERVRVLRPDVGVVLMSGYAPASDGAAPIPRSVFLQKPFAPADLLVAMNRRLRLVGRKPEPFDSGREKGENRLRWGESWQCGPSKSSDRVVSLAPHPPLAPRSAGSAATSPRRSGARWCGLRLP